MQDHVYLSSRRLTRKLIGLVPADGEAHKIMNNVGSHPCCRFFPRRHTIIRNSAFPHLSPLIRDNAHANVLLPQELRRHLIEALPARSSLVAVLDACHSGYFSFIYFIKSPGHYSIPVSFLSFFLLSFLHCPATFPAPSSHFCLSMTYPSHFSVPCRTSPSLPSCTIVLLVPSDFSPRSLLPRQSIYFPRPHLYTLPHMAPSWPSGVFLLF